MADSMNSLDSDNTSRLWDDTTCVSAVCFCSDSVAACFCVVNESVVVSMWTCNDCQTPQHHHRNGQRISQTI